MVTKANKRALVHRRVHMDYVGIKLFDAQGLVRRRIAHSGAVYLHVAGHAPHRSSHYPAQGLRSRCGAPGLDPRSHAGKALMNALDNYPREEMFQISEDELFEFATVISTLPDRPRVRVLPRIDRFDNFVSVLVYLPRDRFDSIDPRAHRRASCRAVMTDGFRPLPPISPRANWRGCIIIIGRNGGVTPRPDREDLEAEIAEITRSFADRLLSAAPESGRDRRLRRRLFGRLPACPFPYRRADRHRDLQDHQRC